MGILECGKKEAHLDDSVGPAGDRVVGRVHARSRGRRRRRGLCLLQRPIPLRILLVFEKGRDESRGALDDRERVPSPDRSTRRARWNSHTIPLSDWKRVASCELREHDTWPGLLQPPGALLRRGQARRRPFWKFRLGFESASRRLVSGLLEGTMESVLEEPHRALCSLECVGTRRSPNRTGPDTEEAPSETKRKSSLSVPGQARRAQRPSLPREPRPRRSAF